MSDQNSAFEIKETMEISDHLIVGILFHEIKSEIMKLLIKGEFTVMELSKELEKNPGTIKRHLDDLLENNLIKQHKTIKNEYGIKQKYYRAVARNFIVNLTFP